MKFLVVGLGSMGKRRVRNLQFLKERDIVGFDPRADRRAETAEKYGIQVFGSFEDAMALQPDALVISTPPELHFQYAKQAIEAGKHFFSEVGVGTEGIDPLIQMTKGKSLVAAPSCTLRFHPLVAMIKNVVDSGELGNILTFSSHSGQYLPDWHPWESYEDFWVSKRQTGACREQFVLEAIWLTWILGPIQAISCFKNKLTTLDTDIDDSYQMIVRLEKGRLGHLMLDVVSRVPCRSGRLFSEEGVLEWSLTEKYVRVYTASNKQWRELKEPEHQTEKGYIHAEKMYIDEMNHFVKAIRGEATWMYPLTADRQIQEALEAADQSAETGKTILLA